MLHLLSLLELVKDVLCALLAEQIGPSDVEGHTAVLLWAEEGVVNQGNQILALDFVLMLGDLLSEI
jgi:hypothetical protein